MYLCTSILVDICGASTFLATPKFVIVSIYYFKIIALKLTCVLYIPSINL